MLTPVDLQQKKFQHGMGYTKKDVDSFFDIVILSYTELYKSNAELTNQVKTLTDSLVHYRTTESTQKKLQRMQMTRPRLLRTMQKSRQIILFIRQEKSWKELKTVLRALSNNTEITRWHLRI